MPTPTPFADPVAPMQLRLLGPPAWVLPDRSLPLLPDRPHGLLALLACRRSWVPRDTLADLLYPGRDLGSARSNLRKVIHLARRLPGGDAPVQQGDLLRWTGDSDVQHFEAACDAGRDADAVATYGGPLLQGMDAAWPGAARDWLEAERQRLESRWHAACARRLQALADQPEALRALAEALLQRDPLDEAARQALARTRGAGGNAAGVPAGAPPPAAAPGQGRMTVVGRRQERAQIVQRLADTGCRCLTLLGPPGVGKSALAQSMVPGLHGRWVPLEDLDHADAVPARIAAACGLRLDGMLPPWQALAGALGGDTALLVLDNCEHLPLATPLGALMAAAPALRLLATSRTPLGLDGEWRLQLDGLPLPDIDERDPEVLRANDAVRLFEARTLAVRPDFALDAESGDVVRLLHEIDGLPLAIELLASWRRLMPVHAMLDELAGSLELLDASAPGERSVRAAFEHSWQMLESSEQQVLAQLAVLPGPCRRSLVQAVLQAPLSVLATLADRSLLRVDADGQLSLHPLLRRLAAPRATGTDGLWTRHAMHVAAAQQPDTAAPADTLPHVQAAWNWAVTQADLAVLDRLATPYVEALLHRAQWREAMTVVALARPLVQAQASTAAPVAPDDAGRVAARLLAQLLDAQARCHLAASRLDAAAADADQLLALAARWGLDVLVPRALALRGSVLWQRGDYAGALAASRQQMQQAQAAGDATAVQRARGWLALVHKAQGDYDAALAHHAVVLHDLRQRSAPPDDLSVFNNMGNLLRLLGRDTEALALLQEALALARQHQLLDDTPYLLTNVALAHETAGRLQAALQWAERAVEAALQIGPPSIEVAARLALARTSARLQRRPVAEAQLQAALAIAQRIGTGPLRVQCLATGGVVLAAGGDAALGVAIVRWAMAHPDFARSEREDAQRHLHALHLADLRGTTLPPDTTAASLAARLLQA